MIENLQPARTMSLPKTLQQAVADDLRNAILQGRLSAGARLIQGVIASEYGISPIPVREALRQLESEGLVQSIPHRGSIVASLSQSEIEDLYDVRIALESLATRLAVPRADEADFNRLHALLIRMDSERDLARWLDLNSEFHRGMYAPSNRSHLCSLIDNLRRNTERYLRLYARNMKRLKEAQVEHRRIFDGYRRGDANAAASALEDHLKNTLRGLLLLFEDHPELRAVGPVPKMSGSKRITHGEGAEA